MRLQSGLSWAALVGLCLWASMAWSVPVGTETPQPSTPLPLDAPAVAPEDLLDRELFSREPGQNEATHPAPGQTRPDSGSERRPARGLPEPAPGAPLPAPSRLLPDAGEASKPAGPAPAASGLDYSRVSETQNPLVDIARRMREAERLLAQANAGQKTQGLQDSILRDLDELLKQISARCGAAQACQGQWQSPQAADRKGGNPSPQNPPQPVAELPKERSPKGLNPVARASERPTHGRNRQSSALQRTSLVRGAWGSLPERQRQQVMQLLPPEQFLPKYESLIEEYYRRLSEENGHARR